MFSKSELASMREVQEAHMMDTCVIYHVVSKSKDSRGTYVPVFDSGTESICGVQMEPGGISTGQMALTEVDVILRLPLGTVVNPDDEIEITKRFDEPIVPKRYKVDRITNDGPSGCRTYLKARTIV